ncbi:retrovirus-related Pol polyprotein from transposon opus [Trichonephila clavipes]|nr:retrovirus-related Pol polyprotein from transposon opus [Trichonephila clavipes]
MSRKFPVELGNTSKVCSLSTGSSVNVQEFAARINKLGTQIFHSSNSAQNTVARNVNDQLLQSCFISGLRNDIGRFVLERDPNNLEESINAALIEEQNVKLNQIANDERTGLSPLHTETSVISALTNKLDEINLRVKRLQEASSVTAWETAPRHSATVPQRTSRGRGNAAGFRRNTRNDNFKLPRRKKPVLDITQLVEKRLSPIKTRDEIFDLPIVDASVQDSRFRILIDTGPHSVTSVRVQVSTLPNSTSSATIQSSAKLKRKNIHLTSSQINIDPQINDTIINIRNDSDNVITLNKNMKIITVNNYVDFLCDFSVSQDVLPPLTEKDFNLSGLDSKIKNRLFQLLISHKSAFARSTVELSAAATKHHRINLQHDYPIKCPIYKIPFNLRNEFRRQIANLEKTGIISKSNSQYSTPALFVKQKEKWRLVLDFRKLNEKTLTQYFVIPTFDDILAENSGSNYFSALDMKSAFNQIPLHFADRHKTAFSTPDGDKYEFNRLCFGLKTRLKHFSPLHKRRYIKNFTKRALPLTNLLRKDTPFEWISETQEAFEDIKEAILNPPVLALPGPNEELQITTNASSRGIGAVLEQKYPNSEVKPLYFFQRN